MNEKILLVVFGFVLVIVVVLLINNMSLKKHLMDNQKQQQKELNELNIRVNENLNTFQNQLTNNMKGDFSLLNDTTVKRLINIEEKVNSSMQANMVTTNESFMKVMEGITRIDLTQKNLDTLSLSINSLQNVLNDKKNRGTFGEIELYAILENQFGLDTKFYGKQYTLVNGKIADAVVFAPSPLNMICIDSKFPLENYNNMYNNDYSSIEQEHYRRYFRNDVVTKIKDIASKYIIKGATAEFAYMFIPAEAIFSEIYARFDDIIALSYTYHVYLVSPTTLLAYLTAMKAISLGQKKNDKVEEIQKEFLKLSVEFERFNLRYEKTLNDFKKTYQDMQDLSISTTKIITRFKDIEEVKLDQK